MHITISKAKTKKDFEAFIQLKDELQEETSGVKVQTGALEKRAATLRKQDQDIWLAKIGRRFGKKKVVGYTSGKKTDKTYISIAVDILQEHQGRRIGPSLKEAQIRYARKEGCEKIVATVFNPNKRSKRMFEKLGFTVTKKDSDSYEAELHLTKK